MKGGCCNVRVLSYIVAVFHLVLNALASFILLAAMVMYFQPNLQYNRDEDDFRDVPFRRYVILYIPCTITVIVSIMLIRGIKVNRISLVTPFLICMAVIIGLHLSHEIISFIIALVKKEPFKSSLVVFICSCIVIGLEIALMTPVYLFYKKLKHQKLTAPPRIPDDYMPEQNANTLQVGQM